MGVDIWYQFIKETENFGVKNCYFQGPNPSIFKMGISLKKSYYQAEAQV